MMISVQTSFLGTTEMQLKLLSLDTRKLRLFPLPAGRGLHFSTLNTVIAMSPGQKNYEASFLSGNIAVLLIRGGLCTEPDV